MRKTRNESMTIKEDLSTTKIYSKREKQNEAAVYTQQFVKYSLLVSGWSPFALRVASILQRDRFIKVLETFLKEFGPY